MEAQQIKVKTVESNRTRKHAIIFTLTSDENSKEKSLINT